MSNQNNSQKKIIRYVKCNKFSGRREWAVMKEDEIISYHREKRMAFNKALKMSKNDENLKYQKFREHDKSIEPSEKEKKRRELKRDKKLNPLDYIETLEDDSNWKRNKEREQDRDAVIRYWDGEGEDYVNVKRDGHKYEFDGYYNGEWIKNIVSPAYPSYSRKEKTAKKAIEFMKKHNYDEE